MTYNDDSDALCSKRKDQLLGFWSFLLLNIIILGCAFLSSVDDVSSIFEEFDEVWAIFLWPLAAGDYISGSMLPWVINGLVILISLAVRPHFAVGFLASFAGLIGVSLIYVASCYVSCATVGASSSDSGIAFAIICPSLVFPAWFILAGYQTRKLYRKACGDKPLFNLPDYGLEESGTAELSPDEIRQQAEREWEERESREND